MEPNINEAIRKAMLKSPAPIALGWDVLRRARTASNAHMTDKELFMAGAGFLFDAILYAMTTGQEPKEEDLLIISKIHNELEQFHVHFNRKIKL